MVSNYNLKDTSNPDVTKMTLEEKENLLRRLSVQMGFLAPSDIAIAKALIEESIEPRRRGRLLEAKARELATKFYDGHYKVGVNSTANERTDYINKRWLDYVSHARVLLDINAALPETYDFQVDE